MRAILAFQTRRARAVGIAGGKSGAVCSPQRAGGAVNVNVHLRVLVLDGVFHGEEDGSVEFAWLKSPSESEIGGLLAPNHSWRDRVVPGRPSTVRRSSRSDPEDRPRRLPSAELLRRTFAFDVLRCDRCGSTKSLIATITDRAVIERFLTAVG